MSAPRSKVSSVIETLAVSFGREANERLVDLIREAKDQDVFAPVTVIVPSNYVAVTLRRDLASGNYGATSWVGAGLVATDFVTSYRLAETLCGEYFLAQGQQPIRDVVIGTFVRQVLADEPGIFGPISHHANTERELVRVYRELRDLTDNELELLAASSSRSAEVVRVCIAAQRKLKDQWFDEFDLFGSLAVNKDRVSELGKLILFLPQQLANLEIAFLRRLSEMSPINALIGLTGVDEADSGSKNAATRLGTGLAMAQGRGPAVGKVVSVSDPDDEVRTVVRSVVGLLDQGMAAGEIAILYPHKLPYRRLLEEYLNKSGVSFNGLSSRSIANSMLGRFIATLLALPDSNLQVDEVLEFLASSDLLRRRGEEAVVPAVSWSQTAISAGVHAGVDDWSEKLSRHQQQLLASASKEKMRTGDNDAAVRREQQADEVTALLEFIVELNQLVQLDGLPKDWFGLCSWLRQVVERYLGHVDQSISHKNELVAFERVLNQLQSLGEIEHTTSFSVFRRCLETQLRESNERIGTLGQGVFVGDTRQAWGLNFEHSFVLGLAEGVFPQPPHRNGLLSDDDRSHLSQTLRVSSDATVDEQRRFLAILSSSTATTLLFPRGDLRQQRENYPARWLEQIANVRGAASLDEALRSPKHPWAEHQPSFIAGLKNSNFPGSCQEFDLASLLESREQGHNLGAVSLNDRSGFDAGRNLIAARTSDSFTRFDGNLNGLVDPKLVRTNVLSPTRLQEWFRCPHSYFMRHVLGVDEPEFFRHEFRISPIVRGSLIHEAADRFFQDQISKGSPAGPGRRYTEDDLLSMRQFGLEVATEFETQGLVGRPLFWRRDREQLLNDLAGILKFDHQREPRGTVIATELKFGLPGADFPPLQRELPSGRTVAFRGSIDRVENASPEGLVVVDYKTGKRDTYKKLSSENPILRGAQLQLPLYALAANAYLGEGNSEVHANYWFASNSQRWATAGYLVTGDVLDSFDKAVDTIVKGIEEGVFPARPEPSESKWTGLGKCVFCDPDQLGTKGIDDSWEAISRSEMLSPYVQLWVEDAALEDEILAND